MVVEYLTTLLIVTVLTLIIPLLDGVERKFIRAKIHSRVGPPILQTYYDLIKLFKKELLVPSTATKLFLVAPVVSFTVSMVTLSLLPYFPNNPFNFEGDLILLIYLLVSSTLVLLLGGLSSGNPMAEISSSREISLILTTELLIGLSTASIALKYGSLSVQNISMKLVFSPSIILAYLTLLYYAFIKSARTPYDIAEAEPEIASGFMIEYSGPLLAFSILSNLIRRFLVSSLFTSIALGPLIYAFTSLVNNVVLRFTFHSLLIVTLSILTYLMLGAASAIYGRYRVVHALESVKRYSIIPLISLALAVVGL
ncbi:MAG: NADH-quinone oxidoreductase subunit H [Sulfolobales archaeon]|nr:NADH-quinone oxidoreductase subunit H [Sulfolobales archaeon]